LDRYAEECEMIDQGESESERARERGRLRRVI